MNIDAFCAYPFNRARVTAEGNLCFCCFQRPNPCRDEKEAYIGNVLENSFDELWFSDLAESVRISTRDGDLHEKCRCPGCPILPLDKPYPTQPLIYNEYPNFLEIDLPNTHCNVGGLTPNPVTSPACIMCERSSPHFRPENNRLMEVLDRIKHVMPNLYHIHIQGIAEPFFQTRKDGMLLFEVLDALDFDRYANQVVVSVTTNGILLRGDVREEYLRRVPRSITIFSIDASTAETYRRIRILDVFERVLENLYGFDQRRTKDQLIRIHNNINTMNIHEVRGMVGIGKKANAEIVEFNPTDGFNRVILVNESNCGRFARAEQEIIEECNRIGQPYALLRPLDLGLTTKLSTRCL